MMKNVCKLICLLVLFVSCEKEKAGSGTKISSHGATESHNVGSSCMQCHNSGGDNLYWFSVAGTVYKSDMSDLLPDCSIFLFSDSLRQSTPVIVYGDFKGNFYTTSAVSFGKGMFVTVKSQSGNTRVMAGSITSGDCNSCHSEGKRITAN